MPREGSLPVGQSSAVLFLDLLFQRCHRHLVCSLSASYTKFNSEANIRCELLYRGFFPEKRTTVLFLYYLMGYLEGCFYYIPCSNSTYSTFSTSDLFCFFYFFYF